MKRVTFAALLFAATMLLIALGQSLHGAPDSAPQITKSDAASRRISSVATLASIRRSNSTNNGEVSIQAILNNILGVNDPAEPLEVCAARVAPGTHSKVEDQIATLRAEDLAQSLANLSSLDMYFWPGPKHKEADLIIQSPLPPSSGISEFEGVLSSRRFLKIYAELAAMGKQEGESKINTELSGALQNYQGLLDSELEKYRTLASSEAAGTVMKGIPQPMSDNPDGTPTLAGEKMRILTLLTTAGELGLTGCRDEIDAVIREGLLEKATVESIPDLGPFLSFDAMRRVSLYNRYALTVAMLGTADGGSMIASSDRSPVKLDWSTMELTDYAAARTPFDHPDLGIPVDYEKGSYPVNFPTSVSEEQFQQLLIAFGYT